ncbi:MAG: hypothetical protein KAT74_09350 [Candidatus Cloacimonetes bacterium]|nr:hypothetical protein [Candidatus Cloacimonadota bacterium]
MKNKLLISLIIVFMLTMPLIAQNEQKRDGVHYIPLLKYDFLSMDSQNIYSPCIGLVIMSEDVMFVGLYTRHSFKEPLLFDYPEVYHSIDILYDAQKNRHQYLGIFKSESDQPVYGGLKTFQTAIAYGYELVQRQNYSLVLGGGLAVSDFGIELSNGKPWPLIPVPLIRMNYSSKCIETKFEFLTSPNFDLTIGPKSQFRFIGECRMDQFRDIRDLIFECSLAYRFFPVDHPMGDFAGISVGVKNDNYGAFNLGDYEAVYLEEDESIEVHYNAVFGMIDFTLLKISGGYAFSGRELYRGVDTRDVGEGYFLSIEGMYQF